ncbi:MAG: type 4 pilus major pilin [Alphaproteobacteria bacterium]
MRVNESGRSMIEMLGVLAIIGVLSVGGIAGYSKAMTKYKTNKVVDQMTMIVTNIRTLYAQQTSYNGLNNQSAINMGVIPDEMGTDASSADAKLVNAFAGQVYIKHAKLSSNTTTDPHADKAFVITYTGLPREACVTLATGDWGSGSSAGLVGIGAYGSAATAAQTEDGRLVLADTASCAGAATTGSAVACPGGSHTPVPMQVSKAASACNCGTSSSCTITWKYY